MVKYAIAVDIGGTNLRVALGTNQGKIILKLKARTLHTGGKNALAGQILKMVRLLQEKKVAIMGVGVGAVGPLDFKKKAIVNTPNIPLPFITLAPLKNLKKPVYVLNDASAGVLGEKYFGMGKNFDNLAYITISSGIGGGAIVDGHFLMGENGNAVEPGHMVVDSTYNLPCACGKGSGHWRSYVAGEDMGKFCRIWLTRKGIKNVDFDLTAVEIFLAAESGHKIARQFVEEMGVISGRALSNVIVAYSPGLITLGGSVVTNHPNIFLKSIEGKIDTYLPLPSIKVTPLGDDIGLLGALAAVFYKQGVKI